MGRFYGLPVEASGMGTDHYVPGIQAGYERGLGGMLPALTWPDILVGPGLLGGSMVLSLEQLLIDVEVFQMYKRVREGIVVDDDKWLGEVIHRVGPGGGFLDRRSTVEGIRGGEWYIPHLRRMRGRPHPHDTYEAWEAAGRPTLLEEARAQVEGILAAHRPLPLGEEIERELARIQGRAKEEA
jgi:trimethylamine:corrinoid methyltransferase-like protein